MANTENIQQGLYETIQYLVDYNMSQFQSDKTLVCTITDNSDRENGHYKATADGSVIYDVYSEKTTYILGEQVLVQHYADPNMVKTVIGRYVNSNGIAQAINYVSSRDKIIGEESMSWNGSRALVYANGNSSLSAAVIQLDGLSEGTPIPNSALYDTLYIKAKFECNIPEDTVRSGGYGLSLGLSTVRNGVKTLYEYRLSSDMMFGNPYKYVVPFEQEILYNYKDLDSDFTFEYCNLYQEGNFMYLDNTQILKPIQGVELSEAETVMPQITISDVEIIFGSDVATAKDKTVVVKNLSGKNEYDGAESKNFQMIWFNKTEDNKYIGFEPESQFSEKAQWQRGVWIKKSANDTTLYYVKTVDGRFLELSSENESHAADTPVYYLLDAAGKAHVKGEIPEEDNQRIYYQILWYATDVKNRMQLVELYTNSKTATIECIKTLRSTSVRCELWRNGVRYTHEAIVLENKAAFAKEDFAIANLEVSIEHKSDSKSTYAIYSGATNSLINSYEAWKKRQVTFSWSSEDNVIDPFFWHDAKIQWDVSGAMLLAEQNQKDAKTITYDTSTGNLTNNVFEYSISESFIANSQDNKILCTIQQTVNGGTMTYKAELPIQFAISGASGTDYTIIFTPDSDTKKITFTVVDGDSNPVTPAQMQYKIFWGDNANIWQSGNVIDTTDWNSDKYNLIEVRAQVEHAGTKVWINNYYQDWDIASQYYAVAPASIIYDNTGANPTYYKGDWQLYEKDTNKLVDPATYEWNIRYYGDQDIYLPSATSKELWGDPYRDFEMEADAKYDAAYDRIIVTSAAQGISDLFPMVKKLKLATGHPTDGYAWIEIITTRQRSDITIAKLVVGNCYLMEHDQYSFDLENCKGFQVLDRLNNDKALVIKVQATTKNNGLKFAFLDERGEPITDEDNPPQPTKIQDLITTYNEQNILEYNFGAEEANCKQYVVKYMVPQYYNDTYLTDEKILTNKSFLIELASKNTYLYPVSNNLLPIITDNHEFKVPSMYTESGAHAAIEVKFGDVRSLNVPIYISLLQHESQLLNNWDGSLVVDDDNGVALAAMLGAGRKNDDNTFSGVVMGERKKLDEIHSRNDIGIFGFNHGIQSYEFNVDGTARLGAPGRGQIVFDGNQGIIASANWFTDSGSLRKELDAGSGLKIDIQQGTIYAKADDQNILTFDGKGLTIKGTINGGLICSTNWKGKKDPGTGAIRETSEGTAFDLVNGFLSTAGITIGSINGEDDNATLSMLTIDSSDGIRGTGNIYLQTPDYRHQISSTTTTATLAFAYTSARATRNTNGRLNIRVGPGNSHGVMTSYDFKKGDIFYFKNKENEAITDPDKLKKWREQLDTKNSWLPILLYKSGSKIYPHKGDDKPNKDSFVGYIYYKGAETSILFDSPDACVGSQNATITTTHISGSGFELTNEKSKIMITKHPTQLDEQGTTPATYMMIGDTTSEYALEIGAFKVTWGGLVKFIDPYGSERYIELGKFKDNPQGDYVKYAVEYHNPSGTKEYFDWQWQQ